MAEYHFSTLVSKKNLFPERTTHVLERFNEMYF